MDENDQNQNIDGIKPVEQQAPVSNVDGFVTNPRPEPSSYSSQAGSSDFDTPAQDQAAPTPNHNTEVVELKKQKKGLAIWLVILLIILFSAAAAAAVYFYQSNQAQKDLDAAKAQTAQAQKDLAAQKQQLAEQEKTATQQTINQLKADNDKLKTDNATLKAENDLLKTQVTTLTTYANNMFKVATDLKAKCGASCTSVTVPPVPTTTSTTTKTN